MQPFVIESGVAAALPAANVDTDVIMPKQFLKGVDRSGLADGVFHHLRFDPAGRARPDFILNTAPWRNARFLVVGPNFGCGSSREHAVWGLMQLGVRALIGTSFAGIFFDNCARNGLLAVTLAPGDLDLLMRLAGRPDACRLQIDLPAQAIQASDGAVVAFEIDAIRKAALLGGLDAVGKTLEDRERIRAFERRHLAENPWLA
jgi:3-isopropylmalate/(R)-2-methylmalate dehydratase small subunit